MQSIYLDHNATAPLDARALEAMQAWLAGVHGNPASVHRYGRAAHEALEAARTVEDHVITDMREADVGSILGFGFAPFTGGTLSYIDFMGTKKFVELCHKLEAKYGSRFTPPKLLVEMAAKGETFYGRFPPKKIAAQAAE